MRKHEGMFGAYGSNRDLGDATGLPCLHIDSVFKQQLMLTLVSHFERIYEWATRIEFQGRGTEHMHVAIWALLRENYEIVGRTGEEHD